MELEQVGVQLTLAILVAFTSLPPRTSERGSASRVFHWQGRDGHNFPGGSLFKRNLMVENEDLLHPRDFRSIPRNLGMGLQGTQTLRARRLLQGGPVTAALHVRLLDAQRGYTTHTGSQGRLGT